MENQYPKIDDIFRQRLYDAEVPPPPFVWPAVEQGLQKRNRKVLFLWLFAFGSVTAGTWLLRPNLWNNMDVAQAPTPNTALPMIAHETAHTEEVDESSKAVSTSQATKKDANQSSNASPFSSTVLNSPKRNTRANDAPNIHSDLKGGSANTIGKASGEKLSSATFLFWPEDQPDQSHFVVNSSRADFPLIKGKETTNALEAKQQELVESLTNPKPIYSPKTFKPHARRKKVAPKLCYDFAKHPNAWLLDLYAGPSLAQRSLTSRKDDEPYLNQRLATERRSTAMNAGVRASLMFNRNFLLRTGLHYDQVTEVFEYIDPTSVTYILKFTPGNPIPDTLGVQYGENYLKTYNRYRMIDIPLIVGVEMRRGRSGLSINAGFSANVLFQKSGVIVDPNTNDPARFGPISNDPKATGPKTSLSQEVFRPNIGLSATASIQWYWHLSPHLRLFVEPSFRQVLRPVTLDRHPVEQRYSIMGLRLGATRIF